MSLPTLLLVQPNNNQPEPDPGSVQCCHAPVRKHDGDARRGEEQAAVPHPLAGHHLTLHHGGCRVFRNQME